MMNKKGTIVLRDIVFMMFIVSSIFVFASLFVNETATNYANTNMSSEWIGSDIAVSGNSTLYSSFENVGSIGNTLSEGGFISLISGGLESIGIVLKMVVTAPSTFGTIIASILYQAGVINTSATNYINILIAGILWTIIIFTIFSAFLKGGKL